MTTRSLFLVALFGALAMAVARLANPTTAMAGDPCYHGFDMPAPASEATAEIKVAPCAFGPTVARVPAGATVTFFNGPSGVHLITGANHAWGSRDAELSPGEQVSYTFDRPGIYPYACALHRGMSGAIVVGGPAAVDGGNASAAAATKSSADAGPGDGGGGTTLAVAGAAAAGAAVGMALVWLATRRRSTAGPARSSDTTAPLP